MENIIFVKIIFILESFIDMYIVLEVYICVYYLNIDEVINCKYFLRGSNKFFISECC